MALNHWVKMNMSRLAAGVNGKNEIRFKESNICLMKFNLRK